MGAKTEISWTDSTWNPIRGCSRVSEGCRNCYAEGVARRFCGEGLAYEGLVRIGSDGKPHEWNGEIKFVEDHLLDPMRWKTPRKIFVNSMSDLFHENVTDKMRDRIFAVMALCPQHTFQILTKRPDRMLNYLTTALRDDFTSEGVCAKTEVQMMCERPARFFPRGFKHLPLNADASALQWPLPNVWLGVSVENQQTAEERIPLLLQTPAAVRFLSCEPLLGPIDLNLLPRSFDFHQSPYGWMSWLGRKLGWAIVGGESGPHARPMHPYWARSLRDQCAQAGIPFFFKQWGDLAPGAQGANYANAKRTYTRIDVHGKPSNDPTIWNATDALFYRVGKKAAGHLLDGSEHHAFPELR